MWEKKKRKEKKKYSLQRGICPDVSRSQHVLMLTISTYVNKNNMDKCTQNLVLFTCEVRSDVFTTEKDPKNSEATV